MGRPLAARPAAAGDAVLSGSRRQRSELTTGKDASRVRLGWMARISRDGQISVVWPGACEIGHLWS